MYGSDVDEEELQNRELFEKPRGERRWLGRRNHKGKEQLHKAVRDSNYIEKTVTSTEPLSKNAIRKIQKSTKDELEFNVSYSLDKNNRWMGSDTASLLGGTPENLNAEIVEKNVVDESVFAVHSKQVNFEKAPGEFDVRSATSSGKGQHYSNFLPKSRELGKKANAKLMKTRGEEGSSDAKTEPKPTISYNIYKAHQNQEVVGSKMFIPRIASKSGRHQVNKKFDMEEFDYEDELDDEEEYDYELPNAPEATFDFSNLYIGTRDKQSKKKKNNEGSPEVLDALEPEPDYTNLLNIQDYLRQEGFTFEKFDITFHNQEDNFERQVDELRLGKKLIIKDLRPHQYLIDVSEWCQLDGEVKDGETTAVIVITQLKKNKYNLLINSTISIDPSKTGCEALMKRICHATTLRHAISQITSELLTARKIVETMRISTSFYGRKTFPELLRDPDEWENQMVNMNWPNQHYHATWANSEELSQVGGKLDWKDLCAMAKSDNKLKTGYTSNDRCGSCNQGKRSHDLYYVDNESKLKCTECLKDEFYRELRARRVPIDLQTDTADELEYLPTFVPLTVINLYIRMISEIIYKDLGAVGDFERCPACKSAVFFESTTAEDAKRNQNRSCPCGYSWCKHCDRVPHWPLKCGDFAEWEEKWLLRYSIKHAQGSGTETLLQVTCSCRKQVYNVLLPEEFIECPGCKINVNMNTMRTVWKHYFYPFDPVERKLIKKGYYVVGEGYKKSPYVPQAKVYTDIVKIPGIKGSVIETCGAARDIRFDVHFRNRAVYREHVLIRKGIMEEEVVENLFGTSVYLVETVTAWMYMTNQFDKGVMQTLESMMENRKMLMTTLAGEDSEAIKECIKKLRKDIDYVVSAVEKKNIPIS